MLIHARVERIADTRPPSTVRCLRRCCSVSIEPISSFDRLERISGCGRTPLQRRKPDLQDPWMPAMQEAFDSCSSSRDAERGSTTQARRSSRLYDEREIAGCRALSSIRRSAIGDRRSPPGPLRSTTQDLSQVPDLPPDFRMSWTVSMTMPFSALLHMS
jgi:hypothetical protein